MISTVFPDLGYELRSAIYFLFDYQRVLRAATHSVVRLALEPNILRPKPQVVIIVADVGADVCDGRHRVIVMKEQKGPRTKSKAADKSVRSTRAWDVNISARGQLNILVVHPSLTSGGAVDLIKVWSMVLFLSTSTITDGDCHIIKKPSAQVSSRFGS